MNATRPAPGSQASLREANRERVLAVVRQHGPLTQVEIAAASGLSAATVSNMVRELDQAGMVALSPSIRNGRRAVLVSLASGGGLLAGVAFGERDVRVAIASEGSEILAQQLMPLQADHVADDGMERAARLLADLAETVGASVEDIGAIGFGLPAPVDSVSGQAGSDAVLPGWRGVNVAEAMAGHLRAPVALDNTANLAALGELRSGALRGGHRGCLDTFVGSRALLSSLQASHGALRLRDVVTRALAGDLGCRRVIEDAGRRVGVAVAGLVNLFNPEVIVVGGKMAEAGDLIMVPLREALDRCAIPSAAATVELRAAELGDEADVLGAIQLASVLSHSQPAKAVGTTV